MGYEGWTVSEGTGAEEVLALYREEAALADATVQRLPLDAEPVWWFEDAGDPPYSTLREVLLHVLVETATHAGHLDVVPGAGRRRPAAGAGRAGPATRLGH